MYLFRVTAPIRHSRRCLCNYFNYVQCTCAVMRMINFLYLLLVSAERNWLILTAADACWQCVIPQVLKMTTLFSSNGWGDLIPVCGFEKTVTRYFLYKSTHKPLCDFVQGVRCSNLSVDTDCPVWGLLWFASAPVGKDRDSTWNQGTTMPIFFSNSFPTVLSYWIVSCDELQIQGYSKWLSGF